MRVLIFGATGQVAQELRRRVPRNATVQVLDRARAGSPVAATRFADGPVSAFGRPGQERRRHRDHRLTQVGNGQHHQRDHQTGQEHGYQGDPDRPPTRRPFKA